MRQSEPPYDFVWMFDPIDAQRVIRWMQRLRERITRELTMVDLYLNSLRVEKDRDLDLNTDSLGSTWTERWSRPEEGPSVGSASGNAALPVLAYVGHHTSELQSTEGIVGVMTKLRDQRYRMLDMVTTATDKLQSMKDQIESGEGRPVLLVMEAAIWAFAFDYLFSAEDAKDLFVMRDEMQGLMTPFSVDNYGIAVILA